MSEEEIEAGRRRDAKLKKKYFETDEVPAEADAFVDSGQSTKDQPQPAVSFWKRLKKWFTG